MQKIRLLNLTELDGKQFQVETDHFTCIIKDLVASGDFISFRFDASSRSRHATKIVMKKYLKKFVIGAIKAAVEDYSKER